MIENILVIRFRRVGDSVLTMPLCHSLKLSFPNAKIHFVINSGIAPLYEGHPDIDEVIPFSPKECIGWSYVEKVWQIMHNTHYDVVIDMRSTMKTLLFSAFSLTSKYRIGRKKQYNWGIHNYRLDNPINADRVATNLNMLTPLEKEGTIIKDSSFKLYITEKELQDYKDYMMKYGIDFKRPVVLTACATRIESKAWKTNYMAQVIKDFIEKHPNAQLVFNYAGKEEEKAAYHLFNLLDCPKQIFMDIEAKSLRQLCALCACSTFFFGNEGGPRHISQAFNVPSFAIYPPGIKKSFWLPGNNPRFSGISPDDYVTEIQQKSMSYAERFNILTVERVRKGLEKTYQQFVENE